MAEFWEANVLRHAKPYLKKESLKEAHPEYCNIECDTLKVFKNTYELFITDAMTQWSHDFEEPFMDCAKTYYNVQVKKTLDSEDMGHYLKYSLKKLNDERKRISTFFYA